MIAASVGGLMSVTGEAGGGPVKVGVAVTDLMTALYAHGAVLAALLQRQQTGEGQKIDCDLLSTQVSAMTHLASNWLNAGSVPGRWGTGHPSIVPYQSFSTRDGHVTVGCGTDSQFKEFCSKLDSPELSQDPRFVNNESRVKNRKLLLPLLSEIIKGKTNSEWCQIFEVCVKAKKFNFVKQSIQGSTFPYGPVNDMKQVFDDCQVRHNKLERRVEHPGLGSVSVVGPAVRFSDSCNDVRAAPPTLGQHTTQVMKVLS